MTKLEKAISKIINHCLKLQPDESILILIDEPNRQLGYLLLKTALRISENSILLETKKLKKNNSEPSSIIKTLMSQVNANIIATTTSIEETKALRTACHFGARVLSLSNLSLETIERSANTDFGFIAEKSQRLADLLSIGKVINLTSPAGTELKIPIGLRKGIADIGIACDPGMFVTMPAGAAGISPEHEKSEGIIIVDGSLGHLGIVHEPIELIIKKGSITKIIGKEDAVFLRKALRHQGKNARYITELGIGTNPKAIITGKSSEDEKVLGIVYLKIGDTSFESSKSKENRSVDVILRNPTLKIDGRPIIQEGQLLI